MRVKRIFVGAVLSVTLLSSAAFSSQLMAMSRVVSNPARRAIVAAEMARKACVTLQETVVTVVGGVVVTAVPNRTGKCEVKLEVAKEVAK